MNVRHLRRRFIPRKHRWKPLAAPVYAADNQNIIRATSLMLGEMRDRSTMLTAEEARDIVAWHERSMPQPTSWWEHRLKRIKSWLCVSR